MPRVHPPEKRQASWYAPVTVIAVASLFLLSENVLKQIPSLTQIQQQLEQLLDGCRPSRLTPSVGPPPATCEYACPSRRRSHWSAQEPRQTCPVRRCHP